jgi:hypothetical protein
VPPKGAEGEGRKDDFRKHHDLKSAMLRLMRSPSGPAGHLPRKTGGGMSWLYFFKPTSFSSQWMS